MDGNIFTPDELELYYWLHAGELALGYEPDIAAETAMAEIMNMRENRKMRANIEHLITIEHKQIEPTVCKGSLVGEMPHKMECNKCGAEFVIANIKEIVNYIIKEGQEHGRA